MSVNKSGATLERMPARISEIGEGFVIRRVLPGKQRRMVGAWCFLDHAGPVRYEQGGALHVGPHPHIGLQTFTWMIEGEVLHRDSLGCEQVIRPGQVNLMTAGRGITHAEDAVSDAPGRLHAAQLWIALPDHARNCEPRFEHYPQLPVYQAGGFRVTVLAGQSGGLTAPTQVFTPLVALDLATENAAETRIDLDPSFEHAALVLDGEVWIDGELLIPGTLLYLGQGRSSLPVRSATAVRLLLIGGEPFGEEILVWWNFVARTHEELEQAAEDWKSGQRFGEVHGSPSPPLIMPALKGKNSVDGRMGDQ